MPAAWAGAAAAVIGPVISGAMNSGASGQAAGVQANSATAAAQVQQNMFNQTQGNLAPYMTNGANALNSLGYELGYGFGPNGQQMGVGGQYTGDPATANLTQMFKAFNFDPTQIANNPQYQWQLGQGTQNVLNNSSSLGGVGGNTLQALMGYGQGLASQNYNNYFTNALNAYNTNKSTFTGYSTTAWYLLADPAVLPVIEVCFVNGQEQPIVRRRLVP